MKPIFAIVPFAVILSGCVSGYDASAVQSASVKMQIASQHCEARKAANELKSFSEVEACELAAERAFATAINLKKMQVFEDYAADMQVLASERDADRLTPRQVKFRSDKIRSEFLADCECTPKTKARWYGNNINDTSNYPSGYDMGMGQGNHAIGPGPLNY